MRPVTGSEGFGRVTDLPEKYGYAPSAGVSSPS